MRDGLILLGGGPWGSAGGRDVPTLAEEIALARGCLMLDKPILAFGLGAQILAIAAQGGSEPRLPGGPGPSTCTCSCMTHT